MPNVPERDKDDVYRATQNQVTKDKLRKALEKQRKEQQQNNKGGR